MRVLVTGSGGFIGGHVCKRLVADGHVVVGCDIVKRGPYVTYHCAAGNLPKMAFGNLDLVIHLAAEVSVADSMTRPERYITFNTLDTSMFLTKIDRYAPHVRLVTASSSSVYGNPPTPFYEVEACSPCNIYGMTKYDQECMTLMRGGVALRLFNCYGPGQDLNNPLTGVLANFAKRLLDGEPPRVTEDGQQKRDFVYIDDVVDAIVQIATAGELMYNVYNVCTGVPTTMLTAARKLADALGSDIEPVVTGQRRFGDQNDVVGINTRLCAELPNWQPRSLTVGIQQYTNDLRRSTITG